MKKRLIPIFALTLILIGFGLYMSPLHLQGFLSTKQSQSCKDDRLRGAVILLTMDELADPTPDIEIIKKIMINAKSLFSYATYDLSKIGFYDPVVIVATPTMLERRDNGVYLVREEITKKFYEDHGDIADFILIYENFPNAENSQNYTPVKSIIKGIGYEIFNDTERFGSEGKLRGVLEMNELDRLPFGDYLSPARGVVHELGHTWCCVVGDVFSKGAGEAQLEIVNSKTHWYIGLDPLDTVRDPMGSNKWIDNGDGTFHIDDYSIEEQNRYHKFILYFMGLLKRNEYNKKYPVYDAGIDGSNTSTATFYKNVSINDIIRVEGKRTCVQN
ncbi:MAG: hypothetical protein WC873_04055 [Candidatus Gracilibacteria bacterium]